MSKRNFTTLVVVYTHTYINIKGMNKYIYVDNKSVSNKYDTKTSSSTTRTRTTLLSHFHMLNMSIMVLQDSYYIKCFFEHF